MWTLTCRIPDTGALLLRGKEMRSEALRQYECGGSYQSVEEVSCKGFRSFDDN
ncbi:MAG: hypothetical protein ACFFAE_06545 [Candidatus Hodarchaeota archaeon]